MIVPHFGQFRQQVVEPVGDFPLPGGETLGVRAGKPFGGVHRRDVQILLLDRHLVQFGAKDLRGVLHPKAKHDAADLASGQVDVAFGLDQVLPAVGAGRGLAQFLRRLVYVLLADKLHPRGYAGQFRPGGVLKHPVGLQVAHESVDAAPQLRQPLADEVLPDGFKDGVLGGRLPGAGRDRSRPEARGRRRNHHQPWNAQAPPPRLAAAANALPGPITLPSHRSVLRKSRRPASRPPSFL